MSKKLHLLSCKKALLYVQHQPMLLQGGEETAQVLLMGGV